MGRSAVLVIGAGDATGGAIARRFAREGMVACPVRRHADKLEPLANVSVVRLADSDIVRHPLVASMLGVL